MSKITKENIKLYEAGLATSKLMNKAQEEGDWDFFSWLEWSESKDILRHAKKMSEHAQKNGDFVYGPWNPEEIFEHFDSGHKIILVRRDAETVYNKKFVHFSGKLARWELRSYFNMVHRNQQCACIIIKPEEQDQQENETCVQKKKKDAKLDKARSGLLASSIALLFGGLVMYYNLY